MKKRWIATALAAVMAAGTLAGCSSKPEETQAPAQVEMTVDAVSAVEVPQNRRRAG